MRSKARQQDRPGVLSLAATMPGRQSTCGARISKRVEGRSGAITLHSHGEAGFERARQFRLTRKDFNRASISGLNMTFPGCTRFSPGSCSKAFYELHMAQDRSRAICNASVYPAGLLLRPAPTQSTDWQMIAQDLGYMAHPLLMVSAWCYRNGPSSFPWSVLLLRTERDQET
jgi:hypothetical protein